MGEKVLTVPDAVYNAAQRHFRDAATYGDGLISMDDYLESCRAFSRAVDALVTAERDRLVAECEAVATKAHGVLHGPESHLASHEVLAYWRGRHHTAKNLSTALRVATETGEGV